jgi:hypothetical protein
MKVPSETPSILLGGLAAVVAAVLVPRAAVTLIWASTVFLLVSGCIMFIAAKPLKTRLAQYGISANSIPQLLAMSPSSSRGIRLFASVLAVWIASMMFVTGFAFFLAVIAHFFGRR